MVIKTERRVLKTKEVTAAAKFFKKRLRREGISAVRIVVFGSYAKGTAHRDSDIDIAVVVPSPITISERKRLKNVPWIAKQINVKLEPHIMYEADFQNRWLSLPAEIKKFGKTV